MISSLLSLKNQVTKVLKRTGHFELLLKTVDWSILSQLAALLQSFKLLTEVASGNSVGLSVIPLIRAKVTAACSPCDTDYEQISLLKRKLLARLDVRFPLNDFVVIATLLDPASKNKKYLNMSNEEKRDLLVTAIRQAECGSVVTATQSQRPGTVTTVPNVAAAADADNIHSSTSSTDDSIEWESMPKPKRLRVLDELEDDDSDGDVLAMVTQYLSVNEKPSDEERADPLLYWKNSKFVALASLARTYLTASASSVLCESMFSITGMLLNGRRSSLAPHTFNRLIFVHDNHDNHY